jgi:hypothetical protein
MSWRPTIQVGIDSDQSFTTEKPSIQGPGAGSEHRQRQAKRHRHQLRGIDVLGETQNDQLDSSFRDGGHGRPKSDREQYHHGVDRASLNQVPRRRAGGYVCGGCERYTCRKTQDQKAETRPRIGKG